MNNKIKIIVSTDTQAKKTFVENISLFFKNPYVIENHINDLSIRQNKFYFDGLQAEHDLLIIKDVNFHDITPLVNATYNEIYVNKKGKPAETIKAPKVILVSDLYQSNRSYNLDNYTKYIDRDLEDKIEIFKTDRNSNFFKFDQTTHDLDVLIKNPMSKPMSESRKIFYEWAKTSFLIEENFDKLLIKDLVYKNYTDFAIDKHEFENTYLCDHFLSLLNTLCSYLMLDFNPERFIKRHRDKERNFFKKTVYENNDPKGKRVVEQFIYIEKTENNEFSDLISQI